MAPQFDRALERGDEPRMSPLNRLIIGYLLAPFLFIASMRLNEMLNHHSDHSELQTDVALYVLSAIFLFFPLAVSVATTLLLKSEVMGALAFSILFPFVQVAAFIAAADALSSPLPDAPPYLERVRVCIEGFAIEARLALYVAGALTIWFVISARRYARP